MSTRAITLEHAAPPRPRRRFPARAAGWLVALPLACAATGAAAAAAPFLVLGVVAAGLAAWAFTAIPAVVLAAVLLVRPSLDTSGSLVSLAGSNLAGLMGVGIVVGGGLALLATGQRSRTPFALALGAFLGLGFVSLTWSLAPGDGFRTLISLAAPLVVFTVASRVITRLADFRRLVTLALVASVVPIGIGLYQLATGQVSDKDGFGVIHSTFVHGNGFGLYLLIVMVLALVTLLEATRPTKRLLVGTLLALATVCMLFTYARSMWLAAAALVVWLAIVHYRWLVPTGIVLIAGAAIALPSAAGMVSSRFDDLSSSYQSSSLEWRIENWGRMVPYGYEHLLTGRGVGSYLPLSNEEFGAFDWRFQAATDSHGNNVVYAHNDYVTFFVELGVGGALLWTASLVLLGRTILRVRRSAALRPYALALGGLALVLLAIGTSENVSSHGAVLLTLCALGGALVGAGRGETPFAGGLR